MAPGGHWLSSGTKMQRQNLLFGRESPSRRIGYPNRQQRVMRIPTRSRGFFLAAFARQRQPTDLVAESRKRNTYCRGRFWKQASGSHAAKSVHLQAPNISIRIYPEIDSAIVASLQ